MVKENTFSVGMWDSWYEKRFPTTDSLGNTYWLYMRGVTYTNGGSADITVWKNGKEYPPPNPWSKSYYHYTDCILLDSATIKVGQVKEFDDGKCAVRVNSVVEGFANFTVFVDLPAAKIMGYGVPVTTPQIDGIKGYVDMANIGNGEGEFRAVLQDLDTGEKAEEKFSLIAGEIRKYNIDRPLPCRNVRLRFTLECSKFGEWRGEYIDFNVYPAYPYLTFTETVFPARARPGRTLDLSCTIKNTAFPGLVHAGLSILGKPAITTSEIRLAKDISNKFTFNPTMVGEPAWGWFMANWRKCADIITDKFSRFDIYPEECVLLTLPNKGGAKIISGRETSFDFKGIAIGENIATKEVERELERPHVFKGSIANEREAEITWDSLSYFRIQLSSPMAIVENKVILGDMDSYVYSTFKLPLIYLRGLRKAVLAR